MKSGRSFLPLLLATLLACGVFAANITAGSKPAAEAGALGQFTFVQMCDTQLGMTKYADDVRRR